MHIIIVHYLLYLMFIINPYTVFASLSPQSDAMSVTYGKQLSLKIANKAVNRINFDNQRAIKIIGQTGGFSSILSDNGSDLFITPKCDVGKNIDFAVLLAGGGIIDLSLKVIASNIPYIATLKFSTNESIQETSEVVSMMEAMKRNEVGKYYVEQNTNPVNIIYKPYIKAYIYESYRFGDLTGKAFILQNKNSKQKITISEVELASLFSNVKAIYLEKPSLDPKERAKAYVILARGEV